MRLPCFFFYHSPLSTKQTTVLSTSRRDIPLGQWHRIIALSLEGHSSDISLQGVIKGYPKLWAENWKHLALLCIQLFISRLVIIIMLNGKWYLRKAVA